MPVGREDVLAAVGDSTKLVGATGTITCKHGQTGVSFGNIVDQFLDKNRFSHTRAAKKANLSAFGIRLDKVNYFDPGVEYFR